MNIVETLRGLMKQAGFPDEQIAAVEKDLVDGNKAGVAVGIDPQGLTPDAIAALQAGQPDPAAPENPSEIAPVVPPTVESLQTRLLGLEAKVERLIEITVKPSFHKQIG